MALLNKCRRNDFNDELLNAKSNDRFLKNFDAANWGIILDEMAFVNRELFEILLSTTIAERRAIQVDSSD